MDKYLIGIDLDGTMLYDYGTIEEELVQTINKIKQLGHYVVICTGRPYRSSIFVYDKLGLDTPLINYNGGLISIPRNDGFKKQYKYLDNDVIYQINKEFDDQIDNIFIEVDDHIYLKHQDEIIVPLLHYNELAEITYGPLYKTVRGRASGCLIVTKDEGFDMLKKIQDKYNNVIGSRLWSTPEYPNRVIELYSLEISKGSALLRVAELLNIDKNHVIAIGDSPNDIDMLEAAHIGVCVANASDEVKSHANVILSCETYKGVIEFLSNFFKLGD